MLIPQELQLSPDILKKQIYLWILYAITSFLQ